jgi:hypothetical protein
MIPIGPHCKRIAISVAVMVLILSWPAVSATPENPADDAALLASICPVVYPLDQFPTERGYRYFFYGNAFFINDQGYLITTAHIVKPFRDGGRPSILVAMPDGSRRLQEAELVAEDWEHDVAILRATPNPFAGQHRVAFMPLTAERPSPGKPVEAVSLFPADLSDSHTAEAPVVIRSEGQVIDYQFYVESEGADSELLLFNQKIVPGQSGSPVLSADSREVVGIVVGQWLHPTVIHFANSAQPLVTLPGAALRSHYAIALLRQHDIPWHAAVAPAAPASPTAPGSPAQQAGGFSPPVPVSLVATPYPPQALFGGEVVLDARIDRDGRIAELNVVHGIAPYLEPVLGAVRTWIFSPAQLDGRAVEARMGIVVQFPQSFRPKLTTSERKYDPPSEDSADHAALPVFTIEPHYPPNTMAEDSVILYDLVDQRGQVAATQVLRDVEPLTAVTLAASQQWHFVPGKQGKADTDSAVIVVVTFRHP